MKKKRNECKVDRVGNVTDDMDKSIGRPVIIIKGTVSANNYIDYQDLQLTKPYLYFQLCVLKQPNVATIHIEIITDDDLSFRISLSTLHREPRFLCRQLRLPLPLIKSSPSWVIVEMNMNEILSKYCSNASDNSSTSNTKPISMKYIKVSVYKNMDVSDVGI